MGSSAEGGQGAGGFQETRSERTLPAVRVSGRDKGCDHHTAHLQSSPKWPSTLTPTSSELQWVTTDTWNRTRNGRGRDSSTPPGRNSRETPSQHGSTLT